MLGARWGLLVFLLDAAKGSLAAIAPIVLSGSTLAAQLAAGIAAILGHVFSPWVGFKGGRGVATSLGVFLAIVPLPTLLAFGVWVLVMIATRRVSVGSLGAALAYPFFVFFFAHDPDHRILLTAITALVSLLVIVRHKANIQRLLQGTEPPLRRGGAR